jgi:putative ABC transport system substrate-binding protein
MIKLLRAEFRWCVSDNLKSKMANLKSVGLVALVVAFAHFGAVAEAQQPTKIPSIARLAVFANAPRSEAFRQGLRDLGYLEGKNIVIDDRDSGGTVERLQTLTAEMVRLKADIIVTAGPIVTRVAKQATSKIPIVMINDPDPVGEGFVASLARPGGNITGLSVLAPELSGKRLEILREVVGKLSRVAVLGTSTSPGYAQISQEIDLAAKAFGVNIQYLDVLDSKDIDPAFRAANKGRSQALLTLSSGFINSQRAKISDLAAKNRLPGMYYNEQFMDAGGLMYYGVNLLDLERRAATYVDKILKGRTPADLPVEQPIKFEFIVNLQAAKKIGLTIPPNVLVRADKVIK